MYPLDWTAIKVVVCMVSVELFTAEGANSAYQTGKESCKNGAYALILHKAEPIRKTTAPAYYRWRIPAGQ
jgi:hypothetical protein